MFDYLRTTFTDTTPSQIRAENNIKNMQRVLGGNATIFSQNYLMDRLYKQDYIKINVIAEGYDIRRLYKLMQTEKGRWSAIILYLSELYIDNNPNIDFFTRDELKKLVEKFKKAEDERLEQSQNSSMTNSLDNSTARLFDQNFFKT